MKNIEKHFNKVYTDFLDEMLNSIGLRDLEVEYDNQPITIDLCLETYADDYDYRNMPKYIPYELFNKACIDLFDKPYKLQDTMERWVNAQSATYGRDCNYWTDNVGDYHTYFLDNLAFLFMEWWLKPSFAAEMTKNSGEKLWHNLATNLVKQLIEYKSQRRNDLITSILDEKK